LTLLVKSFFTLHALPYNQTSKVDATKNNCIYARRHSDTRISHVWLESAPQSWTNHAATLTKAHTNH